MKMTPDEQRVAICNEIKGALWYVALQTQPISKRIEYVERHYENYMEYRKVFIDAIVEE